MRAGFAAEAPIAGRATLSRRLRPILHLPWSVPTGEVDTGIPWAGKGKSVRYSPTVWLAGALGRNDAGTKVVNTNTTATTNTAV